MGPIIGRTVAPVDARRLDLSAARDVAESAVASGVLPAVVFGVSDARGTRGTIVVRGPLEPRVATSTLFFLASLTKPIVATAVMQLVDEGRLDLHAPIARYVPAFRGPRRERVTAWHVLTHTSGLSDLPIETLRRERPSYAQLVRKVCAGEPAFEPGTRYAYASDPWVLLAEIIARLTGMSFPQALRRRLLRPLAMDETTFDPRSHRRRVSVVHGMPMRNRVVRELILRFLARATLPGGGLFGTLEDLLAFGRALLPSSAEGSGPRILSQLAIEEMTRDHLRGIPRLDEAGVSHPVRGGLGWRLAGPEGPGSTRSFTHGGVTGTRLWIDPDAGLVFAFLTNLWDAPDATWTATLAEVYRAWPPAVPLPRTTMAAAPIDTAATSRPAR
jgi:CubicO group peptidase (beta-lactamase class C family)